MKPVRILYVEDNDDLRATIGVLLESPGREVRTCGNAEEAMKAFDAQDYDLVVTDVSLPGLSGVELARRLIAQRPSLWIVLCSGYEFGERASMIGERVRAIAKPFEVEDLESLIEEITGSVLGQRAASES